VQCAWAVLYRSQFKNFHVQLILRLSSKIYQIHPTIPVHFLVETYPARCQYEFSEVRDTFFSTISVLAPNEQFWDCATVELSERYCRVWPVWLYHIFPHDLMNSTIFGKKVIEHKMCVLIFSTTSV
jgi:hypothetical protein